MCVCVCVHCGTYLVVLGVAAVHKPVKQEMRFVDLRVTLRNQNTKQQTTIAEEKSKQQ